MSNYMHSSNQMILWNTVNRIPAFMQLSQPKKEFEFKNIVDNIYRNHAHKSILSSQELNTVNRETILAFLPSNNNNNNNNNNSAKPSIPVANSFQTQIQNPNTISPYGRPPLHPSTNRDYITTQDLLQENKFVESREEKYTREFQQRQNMYKQMVEKPVPSTDIFKEKYDDTAISNMDELIQQYQLQRNLDIPPPQVQVPTETKTISTMEKEQVQEPKKIRILEEIQEKIESESITLSLSPIMNSSEGEKKEETDKKVTWKPEIKDIQTIEDTYFIEWENRIRTLEETILELQQQRQQKEIGTSTSNNTINDTSITTDNKSTQYSIEFIEAEQIIDEILQTISENQPQADLISA